MMGKFLLLVVLVFFALCLAGVLLQRLSNIATRIADLQSDIKKSQVKLDAQVQVLEEQQKQSDQKLENLESKQTNNQVEETIS